jgi:hypothetical protein
MFDADARAEALELPKVSIGGRTYTGRLLSIEQFAPFNERVQGKKLLSFDDIMTLVGDYCDVVFPHPWWKRWQSSVRELLLAQPPVVVLEAWRDFFRCQVLACGLDPSVVAGGALSVGMSPSAGASSDS